MGFLGIFCNFFRFLGKTLEKRVCSRSHCIPFPQNILWYSVSSLTTEESLSCEVNLTEKETYNSSISFKNYKLPGNDGLNKEFYSAFWDEIKDTFMKSRKEWQQLKHICAWKWQTIIKLLEKPNWRPLSL